MPTNKKKYYRVLTIAGSDSSAGAGIQADLKTFSALGCYGSSVLTAITAQNTQSVLNIFPVSPQQVKLQIEAVMNDIGTDAIKIGMLYEQSIIECVIDRMELYREIPKVLDPVIGSSGKPLLLKKGSLKVLKRLLPLVTLITPNLFETSQLVGYPVSTYSEIEIAGTELLNLGVPAVLVKGGHLSPEDGQGSDCLITKNENQVEIHWLTSPCHQTKNTHGAGCTYSSAIAAWMARGKSVYEAVCMAKKYLQGAIEAGINFDVGKGNGPVHHFYNLWRR